jgi:hypothetical protein
LRKFLVFVAAPFVVLWLGYLVVTEPDPQPDGVRTSRRDQRRTAQPKPTRLASRTRPTTGQPAYKVVADEIQDVPGKSQVLLRVVVPQKPTESELRALLRALFDKARQRRGFKYRQHPNAVYVAAYGPNTSPEGASWIGMLGYNENAGDSEPQVRISRLRLEAAYEEPTRKFGLSEQQRKQVYWELILIDDRMTRALEEGRDSDRIKRQGEGELMQEYGLTEEQIQAISHEGTTKGWPKPPP